MPLYEYECKNCKYRFDVWQKVGEPPVKVCQQCGGPVYKVFHPVPVIYRASGFYTTDYKNKEQEKGKYEKVEEEVKTASGKLQK